jgi:5,10-methylenetetrahydromethanopterin reductase
VIRAGFGQLQDLPPPDLARVARLAEDLGYDTFWYANEKFLRDPSIGMALAAVSTQRIQLGTYIADPYSVHPVLTAVAIATLDELSAGRAVLMLGAGGTGLNRLGITRTKPAVAIGEAITVIRRLLAGETVTFHGEVVHADAARLGFEARPDLPIYVASRGDQVLAVGGEHADGVMIATYATPRGVRHALARVEVGAKRAGRELADLTLISRVDGWIDDDRARARAALRSAVARMLAASHPDRSWVEAAGVEIPPALEAVVARRDRDAAIAAAHLVPDPLLDAFTWAGTPDEVAAKVAAIVDLGVTRITLMPHPPPGESPEKAIRAFAEEVLPRVAALGVAVDGLHPA